MKKIQLCVFSHASDLIEGLFGQVFNHVFRVLPYLYETGIFPAWEIRAAQYGAPPDFIAIPGAVDITYTQPQAPFRRMSLRELRRRHAKSRDNDWYERSRIWQAYFKVPARIQQAADQFFPAGRVLGLHFRGNDKYTSLDTNPISQEDFIALVREFIASVPWNPTSPRLTTGMARPPNAI
jgi:hypothetical protein